MRPTLWWRTGVVYQIYPRTFGDTDGDGVGDLEGIRQNLDYLERLGVDAIWLSPFYPSPMADFGYDVADYTEVDPLFGDLATFDRLLTKPTRARCVSSSTTSRTTRPTSTRGSSSRVPRATTRSATGTSGPTRSGWLPAQQLDQASFGGPAWEWMSATGQYYLHSFLAEQPDLNWRNPEVKAAMFDVLRFWLARGVDGLRIDVAHVIMKDPMLRDHPPNPHPEAGAPQGPGSSTSSTCTTTSMATRIHEMYRRFAGCSTRTARAAA